MAKSLQVRPTTVFDLVGFDNAMCDAGAYDSIGRRDLWKTIFELHAGWVVSWDGSPLCAFGYIDIEAGIVSAWCFLNPEAALHPVAVVRAVRRGMREAHAERPDVRRIETISEKNPLVDRWMEALGFESEGILRRRGLAGGDCRMWAIC